MADEKVSIIVELVDKASEGMDKIKASMTDWDAATESSKKFAAGLAAVGAAIVGIGAYSVAQAQEAVAGQKELAAVLASTNGAAGMTADAINAMASELSMVTNFTDDAILSGQNMLLTFTNIGSDVFPQATEATLNLAQKFGSVEAASVQLGKALNDPIQGVTALRKVGVSLTEAQEQSIKKFVEMGDMASAQKVILGELETEFGGLAKAVADPLTIAKNQFGEIAETLGMTLLPYVNQAAQAFIEWMASMGGAEGIIAKIKSALEAVEPYFPIIAGAIIGGLVPAFVALAGSILLASAPLIPWIALGAALVVAFMFVQIAIESFGLAAIILKDNLILAWTIIQSKTEEIWNAILDYFSEIWSEIQNFFWTQVDQFQMIWRTGLDTVKLLWETVWTSITSFFTTTWSNIVGAVNVAWETMKGIFTRGAEFLSSVWGTMWNGLGSAATAVWESVKNVIADSINWIIDKINYLISKANSVSSAVGLPSIPTIPALTFAQGGVVPSMVDWSRQGSDTVPAMLTPGERVLTPAQNREYESGMGASVEIHIHDPHVFDNDDIVTKIGDPILQALKQHFAV